jgi:Fe-S-cluster-containing hydrogenase component 2
LKDLVKRIVVDETQCAGCRICELVCSYSHEGVFSPKLSRIEVVKIDKYGFDYPIYCRQCEKCLPAEICPVRALNIDNFGVITINHELCTSCEACVKVCTYNAIKIDHSSKPIICDLCSGDPLCVKKCPTHALSYVETELFSDKPSEILNKLLDRWGIDA